MQRIYRRIISNYVQQRPFTYVRNRAISTTYISRNYISCEHILDSRNSNLLLQENCANPAGSFELQHCICYTEHRPLRVNKGVSLVIQHFTIFQDVPERGLPPGRTRGKNFLPPQNAILGCG